VGDLDCESEGKSYARYVNGDEDGTVRRGERVEASFLSTFPYQRGETRQRSRSVGSLCACVRQRAGSWVLIAAGTPQSPEQQQEGFGVVTRRELDQNECRRLLTP